ncbi:MAG: DUF4430 domain-containing protein, partial [Eubacterium sp.]|nr:DUF4430 domain-containing protein [Eubacterium sp.]
MNNKVIIAIVCALIVVCLAVGIGMNSKSGNSEKETNLISNKETVSAVDESSSSITEDKTESIFVTEENNSTGKASSTSNKAETKTTESVTKKETEAKPPVNSVSTNTTNSVKAENKTKPSEKTSSAKKKEEPKAPVKPSEKQNISVSFSVNCEKAVDYGADYPKYLISKTKCNVKKGTTVFDLLSKECSKNGIAVVHQNKSYVKAIGGLSEKDCGNASGWTYKVNGVKPMMAASKYVLKDGDVVECYYV